jgi:hypothetical protein
MFDSNHSKQIQLSKILLIPLVFVIHACSDGSGSGSGKSFQFLDPVDTGEGDTVCTIASSSPSSSTSRIANTGTTATNFLVVSSGTNCLFKYKLNGIEKATTANYSLLPTDTDLGPGVNTLVVEVSNSKGSASKTWTITRNNLPLCGTGNPVYPTPISVSIGTPSSFQVLGATDPDGDPITFSWTLDGTSSAALTTDISSTNFSQATFNSTGAHIGARTVSANISDGYDVKVCSWTANVAGSCAITSTTPALSSVKVAALGTTSTNFSLTTATLGCIVNWTLNGAPVAGTTAGQSVLSSSLLVGVNALTATTASGATTTWFVQKNSAPTCAQVPSTAPQVTTGVGSPLVLTSNITDGDDPSGSLLYSWKVNGATAAPGVLSPINGANTSSGTFTPTVAEVGTTNVSVTTTDGFDSVTCTWPVRVVNACSVISYFPSGSSQKIAFLPGTNQSYLVTPNDATVCSVAWTINGTSVGTSSNIFNLSTTDVNLNAPGVANTLRATIANGYGSTVVQDWVVTRNSAPTCNTGSALPAVTPVEFFYTTPQNFSASINNSDADPMTYTWKLNGGNSGLFGSIVSNSTSSASTLNATAGQIGDGQTVAMEFTDGYDSNQCTWTTNIRDASTVTIASCSPSIAPNVVPGPATRVDVTATGPTSSREFIVLATGVDLTYTWERDGSGIPGYVNSASANFIADQSNWPSNVHTLKVRVKDRYNNEKFCQWNVKKNDSPTISAPTPTTTEPSAATYKYNYKRRVSNPASEYGIPLQISAQDLNSDDAATLKFQWFRDGVRQYDPADPEIVGCSSGCPSTSSILLGAADLAPNYDSYNGGTTTWTSARVFKPYAFFDETLLGESIITARVIDSSGDYRDISWKIQANQFTDTCNSLYNGPADPNKKICTLVGSPSIGQGSNWDTNPLQFRIYPRDVKRDPSGLWVTDGMSHVVLYYNDTVVPVSRVGYTISGKTFQVVAGNGADGRNQDNPVAKQEFKFNLPINSAYDAATDALFVSDYNNHRVVLINSAGLVTSFVGSNPSTSPSNNAAGNTDGALGTAHVCSNPVGLKIQTEGGVKYLYVACSGTHAIKKVNITTPGAGTYGQTTIFVGRLNSSGATVAGAYDGPNGAAGIAEVASPWAIDNDSAGNIYWTEANSISHRIRFFNNTGSSIQYFPNSTPQRYGHTLYVSDISNQVTTAGSLGSFGSYDPSLTTADRFAVTGPARVVAGRCYPARVQLSSATALGLFGSSLNFSFSNFSNVALFTDAGCTVGQGAAFTLTSGQYELRYYVKPTAAGTFAYRVTETTNLFAAGNRVVNYPATPVDNLAAVAATSVNLQSATSDYLWTDCHPVQVQFRNGSNVITALNRTGVTLRLSSNGVGNFYPTNTCTAGTQIHTISPVNTDSELTVYYKRTSIALPGTVQSLVGTIAVNMSVGVSYDVGAFAFNNPRGLAIKENGGIVEGFIVSAYSNNMMYFVNTLSTPQNFGGKVFAGINHESSSLTNNGGTWLNDAAVLSANRVYNPEGVDFDNATGKMWIADLSNYRVRYIDTTNSGNPLTTVLGSGRSRNIFISDNELASEANLNFPNGIFHENSSKKLFISDGDSGKIRQVDMLRGTFDTYVGRGLSALGQSYTPGTSGDPRTSVFMRPPRHIYAHNSGGKNFLMWMEQQNNSVGTNRTCALKLLNRSASSATLFGYNVASDSIINVLGNYTLGCAAYSGDSADAQSVSILNAEGFATDGDTIYVAATNDHCILKVDSAGAVSTVVGTCGTQGGASNTTGALALTRYPTNILIDPQYPTNFFFLDQANQAGSPIRYVNNTNLTIVFGDPGGTAVYAAANGGSGSTVTTVWQTNTAGGQAGRLYGIAAFGNRICWSAGGTGYGIGINGNSAPHVVSCADRTDVNLNVDRIVGPSDASVLTNTIRGGAPVGLEQEGINGPTARLNGPWGITFDSDGNLYIADRTNGIIRMVRRWF